MKITMHPPIKSRRGSEVRIGNVYSNPRSRPFFKIVMGIVEREGNRPWNNVVMLHVDLKGHIIGAACQPILYVKDHQDLVGHVTKMPSLHVEWDKE